MAPIKPTPSADRHGAGLTANANPIRWGPKVLDKVPPIARGHLVAAIGEFAGTILFLVFAFAGTQVANISSNDNAGTTITTTTASKNPSQLLYISLSFGFSLAVNVWVFYRISGGLFNPAVTLGMWIIGSVSLFRAVLLVVVQLLGGIIAAALVNVLFSGGLSVNTSLSSTTNITQGVFIEMILTAELVFAIFMLAAEKHEATYIAPVGIGLTLFVAEMTGVFWTGGSLNPARSLGPSVVIHKFNGYDWIYWVGPGSGAILASLFYKLIKSLEYETVNQTPDAESLMTTATHQSQVPVMKEEHNADNGAEIRE